MSEDGQTDAPAPVPHPAGGYDAEAIAKSATWLVGASGAIAAAAIAGLQLTQLPTRLAPADNFADVKPMLHQLLFVIGQAIKDFFQFQSNHR